MESPHNYLAVIKVVGVGGGGVTLSIERLTLGYAVLSF